MVYILNWNYYSSDRCSHGDDAGVEEGKELIKYHQSKYIKQALGSQQIKYVLIGPKCPFYCLFDLWSQKYSL